MKQENNCKNRLQVAIFSPLIPNFIVTKNSYPNITAFHCIILFSDGAPLTPTGGSSCNLRITNIESQVIYEILPPADIIYQ